MQILNLCRNSPADRSEALLNFLLFRSLLLGRFDLIVQLEFWPSREVLNVVGQIIRRWESLATDGGLTARERTAADKSRERQHDSGA